jgi:hypothetical protein
LIVEIVPTGKRAPGKKVIFDEVEWLTRSIA